MFVLGRGLGECIKSDQCKFLMKSKCDVLIMTTIQRTHVRQSNFIDYNNCIFDFFGTFVLLETEMSIHSSNCVNLFSGDVPCCLLTKKE